MKNIGLSKYLAAALLLAVSALVVAFSWRAYQAEADREEPKAAAANQTAGTGAAAMPTAEVPSRLGAQGQSYDVIAKKNLFSANRTQWKMPPIPPVSGPETPADKAARKDVVLYGTYITDKTKYAILSLARVAPVRKRFILREGETVKSDPGKPEYWYTLESIGGDSVVVRDKNNQAFTVELFARQRTAAKPSPASRPSAPAGGAKPKVVTTKNTQPAASGTVISTKNKANSSGGLNKPLSKMTVSEKEDLVKQGKLKKLSTPFGFVYKPVK